MSTRTVFDEVAERYAATVDASIGASGEDVEFFAMLKARLLRREVGDRSGLRILDFGCGTGTSTRAIAAAFPTAGEIVGSDPSSESIGIAARRGDRATVRFVDQADADALPFADASFDVAFTACVFHHIERPDQPKWMAELHRVLRPGGSLFVFEHNPFNPLTRRAVRSCAFDEGVVLLRPADTRGLMRGAGFTPMRAHYYFFFPHVLAPLRPLERSLRRVPLGGQYFVRAMR